MFGVVYRVIKVINALVDKLLSLGIFKVSFYSYYKSDRKKSFKIVLIERRSGDHGEKTSNDF
ncbi:hypothetical protein [Clostridium sp.]|uniref:hypothetical protein n=1 Tax=Clostridium sp. TaxID=1506 RepID=UPI003217C501